jgi:hypothetical protein
MELTRVGVSLSLMRIERSPFSLLRKQEQGWNFLSQGRLPKKELQNWEKKTIQLVWKKKEIHYNMNDDLLSLSLSFRDHQQ